MANEKLVTLEQLGIVKAYIDIKDESAIKSAAYVDNKISLYTTTDKSGTAAVEIDLPEEMFLDQTKTTFVGEFEWSDAAYPGSTNPSLNGKPVLVLAVKGDKTVTYSFISIESVIKTYVGEDSETVDVTVADGKVKADVKISADEGNVLTIKADGLFVATADKSEITFATDDEVRELFKTT